MNPYLIPFAATLMKNNANILYDGYLRADRPVTNKKFVKAWADSGFKSPSWPRKRVSQRAKSMDIENISGEVLKTLAGAGIRTTTNDTCDFIRAPEHIRVGRSLLLLSLRPGWIASVSVRVSLSGRCYEPDEIGVWEIIGANPPRSHAINDWIDRIGGKLKLIRWSMTERYEAEERWRTLHPMAIEVYPPPETLSGNAGSLTEFPIITQIQQGAPDAVLSYHMSVARQFEPEILAQAVAVVSIIKVYNFPMQGRITKSNPIM